MSTIRLDTLRRQAIDEGLLPPDATAAAPAERPWPVVLLTALGAWLAAVPLIGVIGLLLGDLVRRDAGPYLIGMLVLVASVVVLRARALPLFIEQLAVPGLLVGAGGLAMGLYRDLPVPGASLLLAALALGVALLVARPWLRVLLGTAAAVLLATAALPQHAPFFGREIAPASLIAWHLVFALWAAASLAQAGMAPNGLRAAAALEPLLAGMLLAVLAALAWWSGTSLLVGATLGDPGRELGQALTPGSRASLPAWPPVLSALLAALAAAWTAWRWPSLRRPWCAVAAGAIVLLAWFMPALGAVLMGLACCATSHRWRLAGAAALTAAWILGSFYYRLDWPLQTKALVLLGAATLLAALAWWAGGGVGIRDTASDRPSRGRLSWQAQSGIALSTLATLAVVNVGIWQKERLIAEGAPVYLELAPVDPRSLMQGDYMRIDVRVPAEVQSRYADMLWGRRPAVIVTRDARGVGAMARLDDGAPLAADELRIELTPMNGRWTVVTDAWFFKEGERERWSRARYAEFRVDPDGRALLVGLRGAQLQPL